jgi:hypothetical protein
MSSPPTTPYERPKLEASRPNRCTGGFYRAADAGGQTMGGVPLDSAEAAVVAAVRMGYKVAATQIDRSARLARRLREAGDRVGGGDSPRQAVDATERLVFRSMMAGLTWLEALAAERGSPLGRLAAAQYSVFGKIFGLEPGSKAPATPPARPEGEEPRPAAVATGGDAAVGPPIKVRLYGEKTALRAVKVVHFELAGARTGTFDLFFHHAGDRDAAVLPGMLDVHDDGTAALQLQTQKAAPSGTWRAPVCARDGEQVGMVEIAL